MANAPRSASPRTTMAKPPRSAASAVRMPMAIRSERLVIAPDAIGCGE